MTESIKVILGKNIKTYRLKKRLSQTQLAEMVDVSFRYISYVECGKSFPSAEVLEAIAHSLGVQIYMLFYPSSATVGQPHITELKDILVDATKDFKATLDVLKEKIEKL